MRFEVEGRDWPNREWSHFVDVDPFRFHYQCSGVGADLLLLHGAGASTHSFRDLLPLLSERFRVLAIDLPGHGFTRAPPAAQRTLPQVADAVRRALGVIGLRPRAVIGHSAGAAVGARIILDRHLEVERLISINGAFFPFVGAARLALPALARILSQSRRAPRLMSRLARPSTAQILKATGSRIDGRGSELYRRLASSPEHIAGSLAMAAGWNLDELVLELAELPTKLVLVAGENDKTVSPEQARRLRESLPRSELLLLPRLGHLAHEEAPWRFAELITSIVEGDDPGTGRTHDA